MWFLATDRLVPGDDLQDHLAFVQNLFSPTPSDTSRIVRLRSILDRTRSGAHITCFWRGAPGELTPQISDRFKSVIQPLTADIENRFLNLGQSRKDDRRKNDRQDSSL